jgi:hypothetical protein
MDLDAPTFRLLYQLEISLQRRAVRNSSDDVATLLTDDFVEFGRSGGVYDKDAVIDLLASDDSDEPIAMTDFEARYLAPSVVLLTYRTPGTLRSSTWVLSEGSWRMAFHQGTPSER